MPTPVTDASISEGRAAYNGGLYKLALEHFTLVANGCPCNRGPNGRRGRCTCKDFAAAALDSEDDDRVFREAMHTCSCGVAQKFRKCHEPEHIQALDYRIHVFEKMGRLENAQRDAEWLLDIAPRALEGYLRLGKAYRLAKKPEVAYGIWTAGIRVGSKEGHGGSAKLHQLHQARQSLHMRFARKDPLQELPIELAENIFTSLETRQIAKCLGVSKRWNSFLKRNPRVWSNLLLVDERMPSIPWFKELRTMTQGNVESLVVCERWAKSSMHHKRWLALYVATRRLRHLTLELNDIEGPATIFKDGTVWSGLKSLRISQHTPLISQHTPFFPSGTSFVSRVLGPLLNHNKDTLEELTIATTKKLSSLMNAPQIFPPLSQLRTLYLEMGDGDPEASGLRLVQTLRKLAQRTPHLEQLCLPELRVQGTDSETGKPPDDVLGLWPQLKVMRFGMHDRRLHSASELVVPLAGIRCYESYSDRPGSRTYHMLSNYCRYIQDNQKDADGLQYPTLERYWLPETELGSYMKPCLAQSLAKGELSAFGTKVESADCRYEDGKRVDGFLQEVAWMAGEPSITTLGLFSLAVSGNRGSDWGLTQARVEVVLKFLRSFPNLDTVAVSTDDMETMCVLLKPILGLENIKTVISGPCAGAWRDSLVELAAQNKVTLGFGIQVAHATWPLDLSRLKESPYLISRKARRFYHVKELPTGSSFAKRRGASN